MRLLKDAVPLALIQKIFDNVREKVIATNIVGLKQNRPQDIAGISLFIWDEMVYRGIVKKPFKIAPIINKDYKGIYEFVQKELKQAPVCDVYSVSYFNDIDPHMSFVDVTLVQCYPSDIHIADVEFADNRYRVGEHKPMKGYRNFRGLHIFGTFIERLINVARERDVSRISLMVADEELYPVFKRHGFEVSDTPMAQAAFNNVGKGFPMIRKIS